MSASMSACIKVSSPYRAAACLDICLDQLDQSPKAAITSTLACETDSSNV